MPSFELSIPAILRELDTGARMTLLFANQVAAESFRVRIYATKRKEEKMLDSVGFAGNKRSLSFTFIPHPREDTTGKVDEVRVELRLKKPRDFRTFSIVSIDREESDGID